MSGWQGLSEHRCPRWCPAGVWGTGGYSNGLQREPGIRELDTCCVCALVSFMTHAAGTDRLGRVTLEQLECECMILELCW